MSLPSNRWIYLSIFVICTVAMLIALYMQYEMDLYPCPLCITQRVFVIAVGLIGLLAFLINPRTLGRRIFAALGIVFSIAGGAFSTRQLWLQSLPEDQVPACGPDVAYLLENFPLMEALSVLLRGDGNCAEVSWTLLGISIPGWTLVLFVVLAAINALLLFRKS